MKTHAAKGRIALLLVVVAFCWHAAGSVAAETASLETGDIVFQRSRSAQSRAIALATGSTYTHVGIVVARGRGEPFVLEAVGPVRLTRLSTWIARGIDGEVVAKRLRDPIPESSMSRMRRVARGFMGRPYDGRFEWSDDAIYCSELVYKIFERGADRRLGVLTPARELALSHPEVQALITRRFGRSRRFDPDEPVISPGAIFADQQLETVLAR